MKNIISVGLVLCLIFTILTCDALKPKPNYNTLPALTEEGINMVVEIPAGTNKLIAYNPVNNELEVVLENGQPELIEFLPFPGNQGFIPSTISKEEGRDGKGLSILLLSEQATSGEVIESIPVAAMEYIDKEGWPKTQIFAVPKDQSRRTIQAERYEELLIQYDGLIGIIENWFLNYQGFNKNNTFSWKDEAFAMQKIKDHLIQ